MINVLLLVAALAGDSGTVSPSADQIARMNRTFGHAHEVWVVTARAGFFVTRPQASETGLDYARTPAYPPRRPAVVAGNWDTIPPPPRPLPWPEVRRIEWRHGGAGTGILVGTLAAAAILGGVVAIVGRSGGDVAPSVPGVLLGAAAGGAVLGALTSAAVAKTEVIYRAP